MPRRERRYAREAMSPWVRLENVEAAVVKSKIIISCAVTGSVHTPTMSPHLPLTPEEIAEQSIAAAEAGAAVLHPHARNPQAPRPSPDPSAVMEILPRIREGSSALVNINI